jgi:cation diffusion facilitator family transporter
MDEPYAVDAKIIGAPTASEYTTTKMQGREKEEGEQEKALPGSSNNTSKVNEAILAGKRIAKISVITLISIGIAEVVISNLSGSVVVFAEGMDSLSGAMISFIVFIGLYTAYYPADGKFHFGYHKVESFAALMAAITMVAIGSVILYHSYQSLIEPHEIRQPLLTMVVLATSAAISFHRAFQMRTIASKYNLLSLKMYAKNSINDGSASIIGFFGVLVASQFGFLQMDAIGSIVIAGYIFYVAYISLKQSSLILVDAWENPKVTDKIKRLVEEKFKNQAIEVRSIHLRPAGIVVYAEIHIELGDSNKRLTDVELLCIQIEMVIRSEISIINRVSIIPHSSGSTDLNGKITIKKQEQLVSGHSKRISH